MWPQHLLFACTTLWAVGMVGVSMVALWRTQRPALLQSGQRAPPYVLIRPCAGQEQHLHSNLLSSRNLRGTPPLRTLLGARPGDAALPTLQAVAAQLTAAGHPTQVHLTHSVAANGKVAQLADLTAAAPPQCVCLYVDSDVDLSDFAVDIFLAPLMQPEVAATWAPFYESAPRSLADRASATLLCASLHSFALLRGLDPRGVVGKVLAVKPRALAEVGGWGSLGQVLGEDMELGRRLRAAAWRVVSVGLAARARPAPRSLRQVLQRWQRWLWVVRAQRPGLLWSYPLIFCSTLPLLGLCASLSAAAPRGALLLAVLVLGTRWRVARAAEACTGWRSHGWDWLWADLLLAIAWCGVLGRRRVRWRARTLHIDLRGQLHEPLG